MEPRLCVLRTLPDGRTTYVYPYHVSLEGLECALICRDDEDYDVFVKYICLSAWRNSVLVIIYGVVSNHAHIAVLAENTDRVRKFSTSLKRTHSMWLSRKYCESNVLRRTGVNITEIDSVRYARNVLAYIPRNALDNGAQNIAEYKWTGFRAMFCNGIPSARTGEVRQLSARGIETIMHCGENLRSVRWLLNSENEIEPASFCDWQFLEAIFNHDQSFFLKTLGSVNSSEMIYELNISTKRHLTDSEFNLVVSEFSLKWFGAPVSSLSPLQKSKFVQYLKMKVPVSIPQLARCLQMERNVIAQLLNRK